MPTTKKYGHLPPKDIEAPEPWNRINIDLIGPWTVKTPKGDHELRALTIIDPATGWFEMKEIGRPTAHNTMAALDDAWFSRYPCPQIVGYDGGSEFKGVFAESIKNYGLTEKVGTAYNPQSNGIIERVHQVIADTLRTFELEKRELDKKDPWTPFLQAACFAVRSTYHTTLGATPAQLVFGQDMMLPIKFKANWTAIQQRRLQEVQRNIKSKNMKRIPHIYEVGDKVRVANAMAHITSLQSMTMAPSDFDVAPQKSSSISDESHHSRSEPTQNRGPLGSGCNRSDWA
jgi:transposase InsO family protein